ncbi:MAG: hypothetical protein ACP5QT_04400 [Brevinematia bacterium]
MKIAISGGMGFERKLAEVLKNFNIILVGGRYDLQDENFERISGVEFFPEFLTYNYSEIFSDSDVLIDVSLSNKSHYLVSDFRLYYGKKAYIVFYDDVWKIAVLSSKVANLNFIKPYRRSLPFIMLPELNLNKVIEFFSEEIDNLTKEEDFLFDIEKKEKKALSFENFDISNYGFEFLNGEMEDITAVSCSDNSVAISPMNESPVDLKEFEKSISPFLKVARQNSFFIEFEVERFRVLLFRQGRVVVKGTKEKNTALYIYYKFVGN